MQILMAQGANTSPSPAVAITSRFTGSDEHRSNRLVWHLARQSAHQINDVIIGRPARLAGAILLHRDTCVIPALPMDDEHQSIADDVDNDLRDNRSNNLLTCLRGGARALPRLHQVSTKRH